MTKLNALVTTFVVFAVVVPALARAQSFELTPYAGYRSSSQINGTTVETVDRTILQNIDFKNGAVFGLWFDITLRPRLQVEIIGEGMPTTIQGTNDTTGKMTDAYDITLYHFQLGLLYEIIETGIATDQVKVRPFVMGALGTTVFDPSGDRGGESRFSASFGVGFKTMFSERLGVRVQGRYMWTHMNAGNNYFCTGTGAGVGEQCTVFPASESLDQIDITAGLVIAF
jgi:hypothetical protein